eukprot:Platyproteum_vivax@DN77_c0_g1_i1.p1
MGERIYRRRGSGADASLLLGNPQFDSFEIRGNNNDKFLEATTSAVSKSVEEIALAPSTPKNRPIIRLHSPPGVTAERRIEPFLQAIRSGAHHRVQKQLDKGSDPNFEFVINGIVTPAICAAALYGHPNLCDLFLQIGVDPASETGAGLTYKELLQRKNEEDKAIPPFQPIDSST